MKIKLSCEDFIVKEQFDFDNKEGNYVYLLEKKDFNTSEAIRIIEEKTKTKIKFCGNKDRRAITFQYISAQKKVPEMNLVTDSGYIKTKFLGTNSKPLSLGSHKGNLFEIRVYETNKNPFECQKFNFPNYFGEQRFSKNNVRIGEFILERDFSKALELINHTKANEHLQKNPNDFIGALKKIPLSVLRIYLSSVQSKEFNKELSNNLSGKKFFVGGEELNFSQGFNKEFPIDLSGWDNKDRRFLFKEYPELSLEGGIRSSLAIAKNVTFDGNKIIFELPKSSYATIFLRCFFLEDITY